MVLGKRKARQEPGQLTLAASLARAPQAARVVARCDKAGGAGHASDGACAADMCAGEDEGACAHSMIVDLSDGGACACDEGDAHDDAVEGDQAGADEDERGPARHISGVETELRERGGNGSSIRHSNLTIGLRAALEGYTHGEKLRGVAKERLQLFDAFAKQIGTLRFVAGLLMNDFALAHPEDVAFTELKWKGGKVTVLDRFKTFSDRIWTAIDRWVCEKAPRDKSEYRAIDARVQHTLESCAWPRETLAHVNFQLRDDVSRAMSVALKAHIELIPKRAFATLKHELYHPSMSTMTNAQRKVWYDTIARCVFHADSSDDELARFAQTHVPEHRATVHDVLRAHRDLVRATRARAWAAIREVVPADGAMPDWALTLSGIAGVVPHLLLPYAAFVSRRVDALHETYAASDELQKRAKYLPKRFALLPMWKHQPAFVKYGATQFAQVPMVRDSALRPKDVSVDNLVRGALFDLTRVRCRPHDWDGWVLDGFATNGVELVLHYKALQARRPGAGQVAALAKAGYGSIAKSHKLRHQDENVRGVFRDTQNEKCITRRLARTSARRIVAVDPGQCKPVQACSLPFRFAEEHPNWVERTLMAQQRTRGATAPSAKDARRVHAIEEQRARASPWDDAFETYADKKRRERDDAFVDDVQQRAAWTHFVDADGGANPVTLWHITNLEYRRRCGFELATQRERWRRERWHYASAIHDLGETTRRTCDPVEFEAHVRVQARHFVRLKRELDRTDRRKTRWATKRRTAKAQDRLAWRLLGLPGRSFRAKQKKLGDAAEWRRDAWRREMPLVFFGDGSWSARKGSAPMPRKALIKRIATRGACVVEDEFRTSKMCPCASCNGELRDHNTPGERRVRSCTKSSTSDGDATGCIARGIDRDWGGVMGIMQCGLQSLRKQPRLPKYSRSCASGIPDL